MKKDCENIASDEFFIFTKDNNEWFIGDTDGTKKNIISSIYIDIPSYNSLTKEDSTSEKVSKRSQPVSDVKFLSNIKYPIFNTLAVTFCKGTDTFWYDCFIKMSLDKFPRNIKYLVPSLQEEDKDIIGKLIYKPPTLPSVTNVSANNSLILYDNISNEELYENIKEFLKRKLNYISKKEVLQNIKTLNEMYYNSYVTPKTKSSKIINYNKNVHILQTFIKSLKTNNNVPKNFSLIIFLFLKSIFNTNNNDIFEYNKDNTIKNIKNIYINEKNNIDLLYTPNIPSNVVKDSIIIEKKSDKEILGDLLINIFKNNISSKNTITNDMFKYFINFYNDFINKFGDNNKLKVVSSFMGDLKQFSSDYIYKIKLLYPSLFFAILIVKYLKGDFVNTNYIELLITNKIKILNFNKINILQLKLLDISVLEKKYKNFYADKFEVFDINTPDDLKLAKLYYTTFYSKLMKNLF